MKRPANPWMCLLPLDRCSPESLRTCIYCSLMADPAYRKRVIDQHGPHPTGVPMKAGRL